MKLTYKIYILSLFLVQTICSQEEANRIITFFIQNYPVLKSSQKNQKINKEQVNQLCNIVNCSSFNLPLNFGIFSTYAGYLTMSDENGQISFPRKTVKDSINILVTSKIHPVFMFRNTIAYWQISSNSSATMYKLERKQDKETKLFYWDTKTIDVPESRQIPIQTIIIFENPENIYVPIGITVTNPGSQLILPTIYAKNNINYAQNALYLITIKPFFSEVKKLFKERTTGYAIHII